jgi:hypothetical protein
LEADAEFVALGDLASDQWEVPADMDLLIQSQLLGGVRLAWADAAVLQALSAGGCDATTTATDLDGYL